MWRCLTRGVVAHMLFFLRIRLPPRAPLFPNTPLFRSSAVPGWGIQPRRVGRAVRGRRRERTSARRWEGGSDLTRSEEHTSELQSRQYLVCRLLLEKKKML